MAVILVIEDDLASRELLEDALSDQGHKTILAASGNEGMPHVSRAELVILDIMLPGQSGLELARNIRTDYPALPILMASALSATHDKLAGFDTGADDYITKPYDLDELGARITALLRRAGRSEVISCNGLVVRTRERSVTLAGEPLELTRLEYELLLTLARQPDAVFSREHLLRDVWGRTFRGTERVVDVAIASLRKKLRDDPQTPSFIHSVRGVGYLFRCRPQG